MNKSFGGDFIDETSATMLTLILRAKRYHRYWRKTYNQLYPNLCPAGKVWLDKELKKIHLVTKEELENRKCILCRRKKCSHPSWFKQLAEYNF